MRKVTREARMALLHEKSYTNSNTRVRNGQIFLHGTPIVTKGEGLTFILQTGGWNTPTTRERIKPFVRSCYTVKGQLHLNGERWDGSPVVVNFEGDVIKW